MAFVTLSDYKLFFFFGERLTDYKLKRLSFYGMWTGERVRFLWNAWNDIVGDIIIFLIAVNANLFASLILIIALLFDGTEPIDP